MSARGALEPAELADPWDVAVVGAGPAGAFAALGLARLGCRVLLAERARFPRAKVCGSCINPRALELLRAAGLDELCASAGAHELVELELACGARRVRVPLLGGRALSRERLDLELAGAAAAAGARVSAATRVLGTRLAPDGSARLLELATPTARVRATARVVLDAGGLAGIAGDGRGARVAWRSRIGAGAIAPAGPGAPPPGLVRMALARDGYVGTVRLEDGRTCIAAALDERAVRRRGGPGALAADILASAGVEIAAEARADRFRGTPRLTRRARAIAAPRLLALGDAAGFVEPFSGEGIAWALAAGALAAPIAAHGARAWDAELERAWRRAWRRAIGGRQRTSLGLALLARHPRAAGAALALAQHRPGLCAAAAERIQRAMRLELAAS